MALGQRLSGWVAAQRHPIVNSDPALDFGDVPGAHELALQSCLSTALVFEDKLIGVLSLYSMESNGFTDDHRRILDGTAVHIASAFKRAIEFNTPSYIETVAALPHVDQLATLIGSATHSLFNASHCGGLLFIDVLGVDSMAREHGSAAVVEVLDHVARRARAGLRTADILFRNGVGRFVALLDGVDRAMSDVVANRVREAIVRWPVDVTAGLTIPVLADVRPVSSPQDGSLHDLLRSANERGMSSVRHTRQRDASAVH
jgi:GGDEF domain-containing protein